MLRFLRRWPEWVGYATAAWSLVFGALGLYWAFRGAGFPFGTENDPAAAVESILGGVRAQTAAPVVAALGLIGAVAATAMARSSRIHGVLRVSLLVFAWSVSAALLLVIPDRRVLVAVAYAPIFLVGAPFGWPPLNYFEVALPWPVINQAFCMARRLFVGRNRRGPRAPDRGRLRQLRADRVRHRVDDTQGGGAMGEVGHLRRRPSYPSRMLRFAGRGLWASPLGSPGSSCARAGRAACGGRVRPFPRWTSWAWS